MLSDSSIFDDFLGALWGMAQSPMETLVRSQQAQTQSLMEVLRQQWEREQLELLKIKEVCTLLKISRSTLWRMIGRGEVRVVEPVPGMKRVPLSEVQRLVARKDA